MAEGRRFACGAHRHQAVDARRDLTLDQPDEGVFVDRPIAKRGNEGGNRPLEKGFRHDVQFAVIRRRGRCGLDLRGQYGRA